MDTQAKLLDKNYLETRLRDLSVIRKKEFIFKIKESDRVMSKTLYVEFWSKDVDKFYKQETIRISDHWQENCVHEQFIVSPYDFLTKQKKQQFLKAIENIVKKAQRRSLYKKLNNLGEKYGSN